MSSPVSHRRQAEVGKLNSLTSNYITITVNKWHVSTPLPIQHLIIYFARYLCLCGEDSALLCVTGGWSVVLAKCGVTEESSFPCYVLTFSSYFFLRQQKGNCTSILSSAAGQLLFWTSFAKWECHPFTHFPHCHFRGCLPSTSLRKWQRDTKQQLA